MTSDLCVNALRVRMQILETFHLRLFEENVILSIKLVSSLFVTPISGRACLWESFKIYLVSESFSHFLALLISLLHLGIL